MKGTTEIKFDEASGNVVLTITTPSNGMTSVNDYSLKQALQLYAALAAAIEQQKRQAAELIA